MRALRRSEGGSSMIKTNPVWPSKYSPMNWRDRPSRDTDTRSTTTKRTQNVTRIFMSERYRFLDRPGRSGARARDDVARRASSLMGNSFHSSSSGTSGSGRRSRRSFGPMARLVRRRARRWTSRKSRRAHASSSEADRRARYCVQSRFLAARTRFVSSRDSPCAGSSGCRKNSFE